MARRRCCKLLADRAAESPQRLFLVDGPVRLTCAKFANHVEVVASGLRRLGLREGDVASWQLPSSWEAAVL
jgi:non-ribosomal peptide synthetase component E (peptide arylation enzyme)